MNKFAPLVGLVALTSVSQAGQIQTVPAPPIIRPTISHWLLQLETDSALANSPHGQNAVRAILWPGQIAIYIDPKTTSDQREILTEAISTWNAHLSPQTTFVPSTDHFAPIRLSFRKAVFQSGTPVAGYAIWNRQSLPYQDQAPATILIATQTPNSTPIPAENIRHAILHELGHLLGLQDQYNSPGIMGTSLALAPSLAEIAAVRSIRARANALLVQQ